MPDARLERTRLNYTQPAHQYGECFWHRSYRAKDAFDVCKPCARLACSLFLGQKLKDQKCHSCHAPVQVQAAIHGELVQLVEPGTTVPHICEAYKTQPDGHYA